LLNVIVLFQVRERKFMSAGKTLFIKSILYIKSLSLENASRVLIPFLFLFSTPLFDCSAQVQKDSIEITPEGDTIVYIDEPVIIDRKVYIDTTTVHTKTNTEKGTFFISPVVGIYDYVNNYKHCSNYETYFQKRLNMTQASLSYVFGLDATKKWKGLFFNAGVRYMIDRERIYTDSTGNNKTYYTTNNYQYLTARIGIGAMLYSSKRVSIKLMAGTGLMFLTNARVMDVNKDNPSGANVALAKSQFNTYLSSIWSDVIFSFPTNNKNLNIISYVNYNLNLRSITSVSCPMTMYRNRFVWGVGLEVFLGR